jgi:hypothetical protein
LTRLTAQNCLESWCQSGGFKHVLFMEIGHGLTGSLSTWETLVAGLNHDFYDVHFIYGIIPPN